MRKTLKLTFVAALLLCIFTPLMGCRKHEYEYKLQDFLEISFFGENGNGYIEIHPKEPTKEELLLEDDEKYEAVVNDVLQYNLNYVSLNANKMSALKIDKETELSNGDTVEISTLLKKNNFNIDIDLNSFTVEVAGLENSLQELDLFGENCVLFYGDPETNKISCSIVYPSVEDLKLERENKEYNPFSFPGSYFKYNVTVYDAIELGSSFRAEAYLTDDTIEKYGYQAVETFLASNGYKAKEIVKDMVLENIQTPVIPEDKGDGVDEETKTKIKTAIGDALTNTSAGGIEYTDGYPYTDIVAFRKQSGVDNSYFVYYYYESSQAVSYYEMAMYIYCSNGEYTAKKGEYMRYVTLQQVQKYLDQCTILSDNMPQSGDKYEEIEEESGETENAE